MLLLIAGLLLFLATHSLRIYAEPWRQATIARLGEPAFKGLYSLLTLAALVLIVIGYGQARQAPVVLWSPPVAMRHVAALLTLPVFVLVVAAYLPGTRIRRAMGHPMLIGVKLWAAAHLLANGTLADVLLFGGLLAWAVACYGAARKRDRLAGVTYPAGPVSRDIAAVVIGLALWAAFAFWLHLALIGVPPLG
jgi:uncharacterized membrane protein